MAEQKSGFTLLELLMVIAIIAILFGILVPVLNKARENARRISCLNNLRQISTSLQVYANDARGWFPDSGTTDIGDNMAILLETGYLTNAAVFICASDKHHTVGEAATLADDNVSYGYVFHLSNRCRSDSVLMLEECDTPNSDVWGALDNHGADGGNVLYQGGHARWHPSSQRPISYSKVYE